MGELRNTNLEFALVANNLPKGVAVDVTGQMGPTEENIDEDTIKVGREILQNTKMIKMKLNQSLIRILSCPRLIKSSGYLLYLLLISSCTLSNLTRNNHRFADADQQTSLKIDVGTSVVVKSQEQTQFDDDSYKEPVSSKPEVVQHQPRERNMKRSDCRDQKDL